MTECQQHEAATGPKITFDKDREEQTLVICLSNMSPTPYSTPYPTPLPTPVPMWDMCRLTEEEFEYFAAVVRAEQWQSGEAQYWVAEVIWNRINDEGGYGGSVRQVLDASGQFSTTKNGKCISKATVESRQAVLYAYLHEVIPENVLYFRSGYYFKNHKEYGECGGNYFSYG